MCSITNLLGFIPRFCHMSAVDPNASNPLGHSVRGAQRWALWQGLVSDAAAAG